MRILLDRFNLQKPFPIRMPFDGSTHPFTEMCRLIQTDFSDYTDNITSVNGEFVNNLGVRWNHERPSCDVEELRIQLQRRVNQFRAILKTGRRVLFLIHLRFQEFICDSFKFQPLERSLQEQYPELKYHIFVLNPNELAYRKIREANKTYVSIPWQPPTTLLADGYRDCICQTMHTLGNTIYGQTWRHSALKEILEVLEVHEDTITFDAQYNFEDSLG